MRYYAILVELAKPDLPNRINPNGIAANYADTLGWVPNFTTTLNPRFWLRPPAVPPSSQAGILIHELAHAVDRQVGDPGPTTMKAYMEPADMLLWKAWAVNTGVFNPPPNRIFGGANFALGPGFDKINDANCYKYFAERQ